MSQCPGVAEQRQAELAESSGGLQEQLRRFQVPDAAKTHTCCEKYPRHELLRCQATKSGVNAGSGSISYPQIGARPEWDHSWPLHCKGIHLERKHTEDVPPGQDFYKHCKSGIVHHCSHGETASNCKLTMNANFKKLERRFHFWRPKCLRCFPKDSSRIRSFEQLTGSVGEIVKGAWPSASAVSQDDK